jgi:putative FmdB family regulatory protein
LPLYEYRCLKCKRHTDKIEKVDGPHLKKCPHCGGKVESVLAPSAFHFKGAGFYATDYARKGNSGDSGQTEKGEKPGSKPETKSKEPETKSKEKDSKKPSAPPKE